MREATAGRRRLVWVGFLAVVAVGCWDEVTHEYDGDGAQLPVSDATDGHRSDADRPTDGPATGADIDSETASDTAAALDGQRNPLVPSAWAGFGAACTTVDDCTGYPAPDKLCLSDVMGIINAPGGYCTACCDTPGKDGCAPGIDCVGVYGAYLVCIERCDAQSACRTQEHWECRDMYYIADDFPDTYCLPDQEHAAVAGGGQGELPQCPWSWL